MDNILITAFKAFVNKDNTLESIVKRYKAVMAKRKTRPKVRKRKQLAKRYYEHFHVTVEEPKTVYW